MTNQTKNRAWLKPCFIIHLTLLRAALATMAKTIKPIPPHKAHFAPALSISFEGKGASSDASEYPRWLRRSRSAAEIKPLKGANSKAAMTTTTKQRFIGIDLLLLP